mgnify:CR=1 FL=1
MAARHAGHGGGNDGSRLDHSGVTGFSGARAVSEYLGNNQTLFPELDDAHHVN